MGMSIFDRNRIVAIALVLFLGIPVVGLSASSSAGVSQEDDAIIQKIRAEGWDNSQVMETLHHFTDVYGPRVTGSPNLVKAQKWAVKQMEEWGMQNGALEGFEWGNVGWVNEYFTGHIMSPVSDHLVGEVLAWTPSTAGTVRAQAYMLNVPEDPTEETLNSYLESIADDIEGKIVLNGEYTYVPIDFAQRDKRRSDEDARNQYDPDREAPQRQRPDMPERDPDVLTGRQVGPIVSQFLVEHGAVVSVQDGARAHGQVRAFSNRTYDIEQAVPTVILRNEDYGRISRLLTHGHEVELEFTIVNKIFPEGRTVYNAVAEIPGTDLADQVIIIGGHLDSWHASTGATDNGTGTSTMMEAARILLAIGAQPRRTIRVALWTGEEQGLLGSSAYVAEHYGTFEDPKPEYANFAGYFNIDSGTGKVRGASVFGPPEAGDILREILVPLEDLGVMGARSTASRRRGGSDHTSFNNAGLPGVGLGQDPIEYGTHTWHTNLDAYERVIEDDLKSSAIVAAALIYELAMRDEMLPRFSAEDMPELPQQNQ
jgi:carboxypeptidase Q